MKKEEQEQMLCTTITLSYKGKILFETFLLALVMAWGMTLDDGIWLYLYSICAGAYLMWGIQSIGEWS